MASRPVADRTARRFYDGDKSVEVMSSEPGFNNKIDRAGGKSRIGIAVQAVAGHAGRAAEAVDSVELAALEQERVGRGEAGVLDPERSEEHTSELQSLMRISYAVFCLEKKK